MPSDDDKVEGTSYHTRPGSKASIDNQNGVFVQENSTSDRKGAVKSIHFYQCYEMYVIDNLDGSLEDYHNAIRIQSDGPWLYLISTDIMVAKDNLASVLADCTKAIEMNSKDAVAFNNRGIVNTAKMWFNDAEVDFNNAININPQFAPAYKIAVF